ncbi:MAG: hypothetical protein EON87_05265 [Brevundimonas sp.]|nr:MAG: hypothetical protein EON87_05265 [Brevundimonas sp.]
MSRKKKRTQPATPADIVARRQEKRELQARGLQVNIDPRSEEITGIWRPDCFQLLLKHKPMEAGAVTWLEEVIRTAAGENGQERRPDFIRATAEGAPGQTVTADMIAASEVLTVVQENMMAWELLLLFGLLKPDEALITRWRSVVVLCCPTATTPQRQGERVVAACERLLWVRENIGRLLRERQDRRKMAA